ncbi:hypothetical protein [Ruminococcus albus]|uniref:ABC-2 family transporter protein n=1 Tax=Ruminococcus albus TaxID=1264 RepID=A0A1I1EC23_RUMAL|nr:hypothetical protein [Ruminococcus albus]SFB84674.1 hypothetical protein SAMN02910406_00644 [Ruminococcus albus]
MKGLVYKEWKQNHRFILSIILCAIAPFAMVLLLQGESSAMVCIIGLIIGFLAAGSLQMMVLNGDDRKLWSYWVSSTADGYRGFLRNKYIMIYGMITLFFISLKIADIGYCALLYDAEQTYVSKFIGIALPLCFVQIFLRAIDIPFYYFFGRKIGSVIKCIIMSIDAFFLTFYLIMYSDSMGKLFDLGQSLIAAKNITLTVMFLAALAFYYLSYRLTCLVYLKGAEHYDH